MELLLGVAALLFRHEHDRSAFELGESGYDGRVVAEGAITVNLLKVGGEPLDVIERMRALGMPRELDALPRRMRRRGRDFGKVLGWSHSLHSNRTVPVAGASATQCALQYGGLVPQRTFARFGTCQDARSNRNSN